jgi:hypothetical protein
MYAATEKETWVEAPLPPASLYKPRGHELIKPPRRLLEAIHNAHNLVYPSDAISVMLVVCLYVHGVGSIPCVVAERCRDVKGRELPAIVRSEGYKQKQRAPLARGRVGIVATWELSGITVPTESSPHLATLELSCCTIALCSTAYEKADK